MGADDPNVISDTRRVQRQRGVAPFLVPGKRLWCVPGRWWEPDFEGPDQITAITTGPQWRTGDDRPSSLLVFSHGYGHTVYLDGADLYADMWDAWREMADRTRIMTAESERITAALVDRILAERG